MKNVLICGAGMSATDLISYMLKHAEEYNWRNSALPTAHMILKLSIRSIIKGDLKGRRSSGPSRLWRDKPRY